MHQSPLFAAALISALLLPGLSTAAPVAKSVGCKWSGVSCKATATNAKMQIQHLSAACYFDPTYTGDNAIVDLRATFKVGGVATAVVLSAGKAISDASLIYVSNAGTPTNVVADASSLAIQATSKLSNAKGSGCTLYAIGTTAN